MAGALPRGIVTFVFTDIEGSTRLLRSLGDGYVAVLDRHRELIRRAIAAADGHEVSVEGDSLFAAFSRADNAVAACREAQRQLSQEPWPDGISVRVRMGIHTGLAFPRADDYVALAVHQANRVMAAGHGGQVLLSEDTVTLVSNREDLALLGRYRIRDFDQPVVLYQLRTADPIEDFPAIRALPADGHNLASPLTPTIGRSDLVGAIVNDIEPGRLVTLTGPGGVGKTRVAVDSGILMAPRWVDGVWMADLAEVTDPDLVRVAVAESVGAPSARSDDRWDSVLQYLADRSLVIILDNCEHVLEACRDVARSVLGACSEIAILATSREPLRVPGERLRPVSPLTWTRTTATDDVEMSPALRLFVERAQLADPDFELSSEGTETVRAICARLDGLPLFIELAAAQLAFLSPPEILEGLEDRFRALRSHDPDVPDRHRTVQAALEWSYRLLEPTAQGALRRLAVFGGSFSLEAAASVVSADHDTDEAAVVWSLAERSLVALDPTGNETRYRLLETVRAYGRSLLESDEAADAARGLTTWLLERVGPWLPADRLWVDGVRYELGNLRSVLGFLDKADETEAQLVACAIGRFHDASQAFREGILELDRYVALFDTPSPARVSMLTTLADLHLRTGEVDAARHLVEAAAELRSSQGAPEWDDVGVERAMGEIARRTGDLPAAAQIARETLERSLSDRGRSRMYNLLGTTAAALGDLEVAYEACTRELELNRLVGYDGYIASAEGNLAEVAMRLGDIGTAAQHQRACLELAAATGSMVMVGFSLIVAARIAGSVSNWRDALRLHARGEQMLEDLGLVLYEDDRAESQRLLGDAEDAIGVEDANRAQEDGHSMPLTEAIDAADLVLAAASDGG